MHMHKRQLTRGWRANTDANFGPVRDANLCVYIYAFITRS